MKEQKAIREDKDRPASVYWAQIDEDEHEQVEDDYGEESDAESVSGRQKQEFEEKYRKDRYS